MDGRWQLVNFEGSDFVQDDASSIASDWSFMHADDAASYHGGRSRSERACNISSLPSSACSSPQRYYAEGETSRSLDRYSLPRSLDVPADEFDIDDDSVDVPTPATRRRARRPRMPQAKPDNGQLVASRQSAARWNATVHADKRRTHRNNLGVDKQRSKVYRRGPQFDSGFQRKQSHLMPGGQTPKGRRSPRV